MGGSSGLGLATAQKLAQHGFNLVVLHRDRRTDLDEITAQFEQIQAMGSKVISFNVDATNGSKQKELIHEIEKTRSHRGRWPPWIVSA